MAVHCGMGEGFELPKVMDHFTLFFLLLLRHIISSFREEAKEDMGLYQQDVFVIHYISFFPLASRCIKRFVVLTRRDSLVK